MSLHDIVELSQPTKELSENTTNDNGENQHIKYRKIQKSANKKTLIFYTRNSYHRACLSFTICNWSYQYIYRSLDDEGNLQKFQELSQITKMCNITKLTLNNIFLEADMSLHGILQLLTFFTIYRERERLGLKINFKKCFIYTKVTKTSKYQ